jgi:hypothetical protein
VGDDVRKHFPLAPRQSSVGGRGFTVGAGIAHDLSVVVVDTDLHGGADTLGHVRIDTLAGFHRTVPRHPNKVSLESKETVSDFRKDGGSSVHFCESVWEERGRRVVRRYPLPNPDRTEWILFLIKCPEQSLRHFGSSQRLGCGEAAILVHRHDMHSKLLGNLRLRYPASPQRNEIGAFCGGCPSVRAVNNNLGQGIKQFAGFVPDLLGRGHYLMIARGA